MSGSQTSSVVMSSNPTMSWYTQKKSQETGKQVLWEAPHGADCRHIASEHGHKFTGGLKSMFVALDTCFYLFLAAFAAASLAFFAAILASLASSSALSLASSSAYTHTQQTVTFVTQGSKQMPLEQWQLAVHCRTGANIIAPCGLQDLTLNTARSLCLLQPHSQTQG